MQSNQVLLSESPTYRPPDSNKNPGGLLKLQPDTTTLILPDLHARMDYFLSVMLYVDRTGRSNLEKLEAGELQIVCVGDGVHAEGRAKDRWRLAYTEYEGQFDTHTAMDEEIRESFGLMEMVMLMKLAFPNLFHFLKGNHENITNQTGNGNFAFGKYAREGEMFAEYTGKFYGEAFLRLYAEFERNLPLFAVGDKFLVSHSEPFSFYSEKSIINYRSHPEIVQGLTWTDNGMAEQGSVEKMLKNYLAQEKVGPGHYFAGHRAINGRYRFLPDSGFVQIHNPDRSILAILKRHEAIDVDIDIREIPINVPDK